jgi:hypothetical protein
MNYDRLVRREVHGHLSRSEVEIHRWSDDCGLCLQGVPTE